MKKKRSEFKVKGLKVISGAQIGADIAGLRAAKRLGIDTGGYVTATCKTKEGPKPELLEKYNLTPLSSESYAKRTHRNVKTADATINFYHTAHSPGMLCTFGAIGAYEKPYFDVKMVRAVYPEDLEFIAESLFEMKARVINIAGNSDKNIEKPVQVLVEVILQNLLWMERDYALRSGSRSSRRN